AGNAWRANPDHADVTAGLQVLGIHAATAADACAALLAAIPAKVSAFAPVGHGLAGRVEEPRLLSDRAWMQIDHHRSRRQEAGERKAGVYAAPVERQPVAGMIRRGRQTDQELGLGARRDEQLDDPLANDRVLAEQRRELAQKPFRTGRSVFSPPRRQRVDEVAYGLSDLVCSFLVEKPHRTNSTPPASAGRPASFTSQKLPSSVRPRQPRHV